LPLELNEKKLLVYGTCAGRDERVVRGIGLMTKSSNKYVCGKNEFLYALERELEEGKDVVKFQTLCNGF